MRLIVLTLQVFLALCPGQSRAPAPPDPPPLGNVVLTPQPPITSFPRQAPFCVTDRTEPDLKNFKPIFDHFNSNPTQFVPVSPDTEHSPTGFIRNVSLSRIHIKADNLPPDHWYRSFHNYFHISINAIDGNGIEGLYVQPIGAPLGVPFGEFDINFDCLDCKVRASELEKITSLVPCQYVPAASYMQANVISIGGSVDVNNPVKFKQAHFNFRYVDYPCFDVTFAQFLIIAVRRWAPPMMYEVFYSPLYKVNIEAVGAPYPMYYGWTTDDIVCHHRRFSYMENWRPVRNQRTKIKYSEEFDRCTYTDNKDRELDADVDINGDPYHGIAKKPPGNICKPGPVTCGQYKVQDMKKVPQSGNEWTAFREKYSISKDPKGTEYICKDCGEWVETIGKPNWTQPPVSVTDKEDINNIIEIYITQKPIFYDANANHSCEKRDRYHKNENNSRSGDAYCLEGNFDDDLAHRGVNFGKSLLSAHSVLLVFTFTVGSNCLIYCARFLKEASFAEKGSGCFGVGKWLWEHIFFTYLSFTSMFCGIFLLSYCEKGDVCKIFDEAEATNSCEGWDSIHRLVGSIAVFVFIMGYVSGWVRPKNKTIRMIVIWYHAVSGYLAKYIGWLNMILAPAFLDTGGIVFLVMTEVSFLAFFGIATFVNWKMDSQMKFRVRERKFIPVPEGIDTFSQPPLKTIRALLFPVFIVIQMLWFSLLVLFELHDAKKSSDTDDIL